MCTSTGAIKPRKRAKNSNHATSYTSSARAGAKIYKQNRIRDDGKGKGSIGRHFGRCGGRERQALGLLGRRRRHRGLYRRRKNKLIPSLSLEPEVISKFECRAIPGFAVAPEDESFYLRHERGNGLEECEEEELPETSRVADALVGKIEGSGAASRAGWTTKTRAGWRSTTRPARPRSGDATPTTGTASPRSRPTGLSSSASARGI